jgi:hypothetical protein
VSLNSIDCGTLSVKSSEYKTNGNLFFKKRVTLFVVWATLNLTQQEIESLIAGININTDSEDYNTLSKFNNKTQFILIRVPRLINSNYWN